MGDYARFCKIKLDDGSYQLNLTESGTSPFLLTGKLCAWLTKYSIDISFWSLMLGSYQLTLADNCSFIVQLIYLISTFFIIFKIPGFSLNRALREHCRWVSAYRKRKTFYKKMRKLECKKNNRNCKKIEAKQAKLVDDLIKYLKKETKRITKANKNYSKLAKRNGGMLCGVKGLAYDVYNFSQETADKAIFHNKNLFMKLAPQHKDFIQERFETLGKIYYKLRNDPNGTDDEFIWSARNPDRNVIKNDCIRKGETSDYVDRIKRAFVADSGEEKVEYSSLEVKEKSLDDLKEQLIEENSEDKFNSVFSYQKDSKTKNSKFTDLNASYGSIDESSF